MILANDGSIAYQGHPNAIAREAKQSLHSFTALRELNAGQHEDVNIVQPVEDTGQGALALAREDAGRKTGDRTVYWYYARSSGYTSTFIFLLGSACTAAGWQIGVYWIKRWSEDVLTGRAHGVSYYIGIYGLITAGAAGGLMATAGGSMVFMVSRGSRTFHEALLEGVSRASVSYFSAGDISVTINRFIQDLRLM